MSNAFKALISDVAIPDTQNQAWAEDTSTFGHRMLLKMGWKAGKGLGKDESGMTENIKSTKKIDDRGLGAEADHTGNSGWAETQVTFTSVLGALNAKYGKNAKAAKKEKKEKKRQREASSSSSQEAPAGQREKKRKRKSRYSDDEPSGSASDSGAEAEAKKEKKGKKEKKEKKERKAARSSRHRVSRKRFIASKNVGGYSSKDLAAVLGVAPAARA